MKIAFCIYNFDRRKGGAERYVVDFAGYLSSRGHDIHIFCNRVSSEDAAPFTIHHVPVSPVKGYFRAMSYAANARKLLDASAVGFDVTQAFGRVLGCDAYQPHSGVHLAQVACTNAAYPSRLYRAGRKLVKLASPKEYAYRNLEAAIYTTDRPLAYIALSKMVATHMKEYYSVPDDMIELIYNGTDLDRFHPGKRESSSTEIRAKHGLARGDYILLFVGLNYRRKGLDTLFAAARLLVRTHDRSDFRILVVGPPDAGYESAAERLGIARRVVFAGTTDEVEKYYAAADVCVLPTYYDPCPLVVFESLASGTPVVTTATNGAGEILTEGKEGFVIEEPGDAVELAGALLETMNRARLESMRKRARRLAERYPISTSYRKMEELYEKLARVRKTADGRGAA